MPDYDAINEYKEIQNCPFLIQQLEKEIEIIKKELLEQKELILNVAKQSYINSGEYEP